MGIYKNKEISKFTCEFKDKELEKELENLEAEMLWF